MSAIARLLALVRSRIRTLGLCRCRGWSGPGAKSRLDRRLGELRRDRR